MLYLYQARVIRLEKEYNRARRELRRLMKRVRSSPDPVDRKAVRVQLDLMNTLLRLNREESAFLLRLGQIYDYVRLLHDVLDKIKEHDPDWYDKIIEEIKEMLNETEYNPQVKKAVEGFGDYSI